MHRYKRAFALTALLLAAALLCGCGGSGGAPARGGDRLRIVATIFPAYDWTRRILGDRADRAELTLLSGNGVDLHSFQPTVDDIVRISGCDLFLYVGGESDAWVDDALAEAVNPDLTALSLLDAMGAEARTEELTEGMQAEAEEDGAALDEHVWLSLRAAALLVDAIAGALIRLDPEGRETYRANAGAYREALAALDARYAEAVRAGRTDVLLFGDRFPFRYLADDYGLAYYAAFPGCSAETEASFSTVVFLAEKMDALGLKHILTMEDSDGKLARTIVENTRERSAEILVMDSLQSVTASDAENGRAYLSAMEENLEILRRALE